jgi:hypothetical protein
MKVGRLSGLSTRRLYPQEIFLVLISVRGHSPIVRPEGWSMKKSSNLTRNRTRDLPVCSAVPKPLRHRVPQHKVIYCVCFHCSGEMIWSTESLENMVAALFRHPNFLCARVHIFGNSPNNVTLFYHTPFLTRSVQLIFSIFLQHQIWNFYRCFLSTSRSVHVLAP